MQIRVKNHSYILDFPESGFDGTLLRKTVTAEINGLLESCQHIELEGWELELNFIYNSVNELLIYRKGRSYPAEKYKELTIHIPIPTIDVVSWGVEPEQRILATANFEKIMKNFECLPVDYTQFGNRFDYIIDCMRRAVAALFEKGVRINGIMLKK